MIYVSQVIMLYTLIIYMAVYQLYLNKIEKKKKNPFHHYQEGLCDFLTLTQVHMILQGRLY